MSVRPVTMAEVPVLKAGPTERFRDGTKGEVEVCAPSGSHAPDVPEAAWPVGRHDGVMVKDRLAGLICFDRAGSEAGEISWAEEPS